MRTTWTNCFGTLGQRRKKLVRLTPGSSHAVKVTPTRTRKKCIHKLVWKRWLSSLDLLALVGFLFTLILFPIAWHVSLTLVSSFLASYDICKNNIPVAKLSLIKTRFKLGETVHGVISFTSREVPTYQISVTLETVEVIEPSYACRSAVQTSKLTKRVHAELHESCIDTMRTSFSLCIPPTATPEFKTSTRESRFTLLEMYTRSPLSVYADFAVFSFAISYTEMVSSS